MNNQNVITIVKDHARYYDAQGVVCQNCSGDCESCCVKEMHEQLANELTEFVGDQIISAAYDIGVSQIDGYTVRTLTALPPQLSSLRSDIADRFYSYEGEYYEKLAEKLREAGIVTPDIKDFLQEEGGRQ